MMSRVLARLKFLLPALGTLAIAIPLIGYGTGNETLECSRSTGTCTWQSGSFGGCASDSTFAIADVRDVQLVETSGKSRRSSVQLIFASGLDREFGSTRDRGDAQQTVDRAKAFFAYGSTVPAFRHASEGSRWFTILGVALFALAIGLGIHGARRRVVETVPTKYNTPPEKLPEAVVHGSPAARFYHTHRRRILLAFIALAGFLVFFSIVVVTSRGQGVLELRCKQRCRFGGMECLPGGSMDMQLDPGTYTIEVLAPTGPQAWVPRTFTIEQDTATTFVCQ